MAVVERDGVTERALTQVKAVDRVYPIYGQTILEPDISLADALAITETRGAVAEQTLLDRLGITVGDSVRLGENSFEIRAVLRREPDTSNAGFSFGPRLLILADALEGSGLITQGTIFETDYRLRLSSETNLDALRESAEAYFSDAGMRWRDRRRGAPGTARFVERMGSFLVLVGLSGLAVGGIGVSAAVRTYLETKTDTIAALKTLGAGGNIIFGVYFLVIGILALIGVTLGVIVGAALPFFAGPIVNASLPVPAIFGIYANPLIEAALYGILTAAIFTLWPLARARDIRAAGLFRDQTAPQARLPRWPFVLLTLALAAALIAAAAILSRIPTLALWSAFGVIAALAVLAIAAWGAKRLAANLSRKRSLNGRPATRLALGAVGGPGGETQAVVLSLGLGLGVLATIGQIDANLRNLISGELPDIAPAYFVVDIQKDQHEAFVETANNGLGVTRLDTAPMLRGIITEINGQPAREVAGAHWVLRGDRGVTYSDTPPEDAIITEGDWWEPGTTTPQVSVAEEEGRELGLKLGDTITINILGRDIVAEIANFRVVDFGNLGINFITILNEAALAGAPHTHIATLYAEQNDEGPLLRAIAEKFPNITAIRTRDAIERAADTVRALASATSWSAAATLFTGFVVLIGAAAAGERRRVFEAAILKTIGATRASILASFAMRSALLGLAAGIVAVAAGATAGWAVMTFVMDGTFTFEPVSAILIVVGGALVNLLAGLFFALRPLAARPAQVLRSRD